MIGLVVDAKGDIEFDDHHTIEVVGILLGEAFRQAIGDKRGIKRMADATVTMDESVAKVAIDISGRSYCNMEFDFTNEKIGDMTSEIVVHFFESFASSAKLNIYGVSKGANDHHQAEAVFKAFAKSLKEAIKHWDLLYKILYKDYLQGAVIMGKKYIPVIENVIAVEDELHEALVKYLSLES